MTLQEAMAELERLGGELTRKTWMRHAAPAPLFGVPYAALYKLRKRIGTDVGLARSLWITGNHDARVLATLVVDPVALSREELDAWLGDAHYRLLNDAVAGVAANSPHARPVAEVWRRDPGEWTSAAGWNVVARLAAGDLVTDEWLADRLVEIERDLRAAPNMTRYCMNSALIAIGGYRPALTARAQAAAKRIGKVEVDHGDSSCKTPEAASYIRKMVERRAKKRPAARKKAAGARRRPARRRAR
jgi:hypothetical protein